MSDAGAEEVYRRLGDLERDTRSLFKAISELTVEMRVVAVATNTIQETLVKLSENTDKLHQHDLLLNQYLHELGSVKRQLELVPGLRRDLDTVEDEVRDNKVVTTLIKRVSVSILLSAAGLITATIMGA